MSSSSASHSHPIAWEHELRKTIAKALTLLDQELTTSESLKLDDCFDYLLTNMPTTEYHGPTPELLKLRFTRALEVRIVEGQFNLERIQHAQQLFRHFETTLFYETYNLTSKTGLFPWKEQRDRHLFEALLEENLPKVSELNTQAKFHRACFIQGLLGFYTTETHRCWRRRGNLPTLAPHIASWLALLSDHLKQETLLPLQVIQILQQNTNALHQWLEAYSHKPRLTFFSRKEPRQLPPMLPLSAEMWEDNPQFTHAPSRAEQP